MADHAQSLTAAGEELDHPDDLGPDPSEVRKESHLGLEFLISNSSRPVRANRSLISMTCMIYGIARVVGLEL